MPHASVPLGSETTTLRNSARNRGSAAWQVAILGLLFSLIIAACSDEQSDEAATASSDPTEESGVADTTATTDGPSSSETELEPEETEVTAESSNSNGELTADRPYEVFVPSSYDAAVATPLLLLLHGYTGTGDSQESYFEFEPLAESRGFLYVHPDGTVDGQGAQFWNATDACCAFSPDPPDDAAYLLAIIDEVSAEYNVDPKAVFVAGHSNGGFMSYRMACDHADRIAGVASLAGATLSEDESCTPSEPVSVLQIHGTNDVTILYRGGAILGDAYPGADDTVATWATLNGCEGTPTTTPDALDLDDAVDGIDSEIDAFASCEQNTAVELWTIDGGGHVPDVTEEFSASVVDFLLAHPKP